MVLDTASKIGKLANGVYVHYESELDSLEPPE
jgi:hypothetical protein